MSRRGTNVRLCRGTNVPILVTSRAAGQLTRCRGTNVPILVTSRAAGQLTRCRGTNAQMCATLQGVAVRTIMASIGELSRDKRIILRGVAERAYQVRRCCGTDARASSRKHIGDLCTLHVPRTFFPSCIATALLVRFSWILSCYFPVLDE